MAKHSSAGVYVKEYDLSQTVRAATLSIGAIVGSSRKGPVNQRTLITSTKQFLQTFGKPNASALPPQNGGLHNTGAHFMHYAALEFLNESSQLYVTRVAPEARTGGLRVYYDGNFNHAESWAGGTEFPTEEPFGSQDLFHVYGVDPGVWNDGISVQFLPNVYQDDSSFYVLVFSGLRGVAVESFLVTLYDSIDGFGRQTNIEDVINNGSQYIRVSQNRNHADFIANPKRNLMNSVVAGTGSTMGVPLVGGSDGVQPTFGDIINAWTLYEDPEVVDINMLINGGYSVPPIQQAMVSLAEDRMDCVAILDMPSHAQTVQGAMDYRRNLLNIDSSYAALYSPDYLIHDKYNDIQLYVPPSGHVAAAYAHTDNNYNVWFAPAGMSRGNLLIDGVRHEYNLGDRDALVESQINPTRVFEGRGIKIWGADTLQSMQSSLSNVSVRRLMIFLEKSLAEAALYSVFDPNDEILRAFLVDLCERFLRPIKDARGIYWFGVKCDEENNPPESIANGDVILDVYIDPSIPVKRIHLTAIVNRTGSRVIGTARNNG